jgi:Protein of unknown function (DUF3175)
MASRKVSKSASRAPKAATRSTTSLRNAAAGRGRATASRKKRPTLRVHKWSGAVTKNSDALDLEPGVFKSRSAQRIAQSLKRSADASHRRKTTPFQSAMSMLNFEINRAGRGLSAARRQVLNRAKIELRKVYGRA